MCKAYNVNVNGLGGCVILLQVWGFTRIPFLAPISSNTPRYSYTSLLQTTRRRKISLATLSITSRLSFQHRTYVTKQLHMEVISWIITITK
ncbi:unnamed protein product [Lathyrus sativus]|nr:unnamed protein product [Lathyrus sativus]